MGDPPVPKPRPPPSPTPSPPPPEPIKPDDPIPPPPDQPDMPPLQEPGREIPMHARIMTSTFRMGLREPTIGASVSLGAAYSWKGSRNCQPSKIGGGSAR